jgi:competence protein ComEA
VEPSGAPWRALEAPESGPPPEAPATRGAPWLAIAAVAVVVVAGAALVFASRSDPSIDVDGALVGTTDDLGESPNPSEPAELLVVEVGGAVAEPGVYRLPAGSRVGDAVVAAGGFGARVDAALADRQLNLAAPLRDGDEVHVPVRGEAAAPGPSDGGPAAGDAGGPIDLNLATAAQLDTLPGIGPVTAAKILAAREEQPFTSIDDLGTRKVVGSATLEKIRALVIVGP